MKYIILLCIATMVFLNANQTNKTFIQQIKVKAYQNDLQSQYMLYNIYKNGYKDIKKSTKKAYRWLLLSAENGYIKSQKSLGIIFLEGTLHKHQNIKKSFYWFSKAAKNGDSYSQFRLGTFYEAGVHVSKNLDKSIYWFSKAAKNGEKEALKKLKQLEKHPEIYGYEKKHQQKIKKALSKFSK